VNYVTIDLTFTTSLKLN